jgi:uncharacterized membrane protein (DUF106 family)
MPDTLARLCAMPESMREMEERELLYQRAYNTAKSAGDWETLKRLREERKCQMYV